MHHRRKHHNKLIVAGKTWVGEAVLALSFLTGGLLFAQQPGPDLALDEAATAFEQAEWAAASARLRRISLGGFSSLQDPNNRSLERSLSQFDATHLLNVSYVWDIPIGRGQLIGRNWNPVVNTILGGWKTNAIWQFASGQPLGLFLANGQSLPTYGSQRPDLLGQLKKGSGSNSDLVNQYFANPEVAVAPPAFALGTAPRVLPNLRGPGIEVANLALFKEFSLARIRESMRAEFRAEAFNALNHPGFCAPNTTVNGGSFGQITGMCTAPREVQLALKFYF